MKILFFPDPPGRHAKIRYILKYLNIPLTNDPKDDWTHAIWWSYDTVRTLPKELMHPGNGRKVINARCADASKSKLRKAAEVFNLDPAINFEAPYCVKKSELQASKDISIVKTADHIDDNFNDEDYIYQRLIDNRCDIDKVYDLRVVYVSGEIPLILRKEKPIANTFKRVNTDYKAEKVSIDMNALSNLEKERLISFCRFFLVDYCELDVLRCNSNGHIYVVDMNNTPHSGGFYSMVGSVCKYDTLIQNRQAKRALKIMAESIKKRLLN